MESNIKPRICTDCRRDSTEVKFYTSQKIKHGKCKLCWSAYTKRWRNSRIELHRKQVRENMRKYRWGSLGITIEQYNALLTSQNGMCAICQATSYAPSGGTLAVDHDHATGAVRGLLCRACNLLLSKAKDNIEILRRAIRYLNKKEE